MTLASFQYCGHPVQEHIMTSSRARAHDDIMVIAAEEKERVTVKILKPVEFPTCSKK